jgi:multidrug efflux pump subunit AcrB
MDFRPACSTGRDYLIPVYNGHDSGVPALMGAIRCLGVSTSNSILVVNFATEKLTEGSDPVTAALEAGFTRFRPVLMTALAWRELWGVIPVPYFLDLACKGRRYCGRLR